MYLTGKKSTELLLGKKFRTVALYIQYIQYVLYVFK